MKCCTKCGLTQPLSSFSKRYEGLSYWCKSCMSQAKKSWVKTHRNQVNSSQKRRRVSNPASFKLIRRRSTLKQYGLTLQAFAEMLDSQEHRCAICGTNKPGGFANQWAIDHCHTTGVVRGLLCTNCNKGLGYFKDDITLFRIAARYLAEKRTSL